MSNIKQDASTDDSVPTEESSLSRRGFIGGLSGLAAASGTVGSVGIGAVALSGNAAAEYKDPLRPNTRKRMARKIREDAAAAASLVPSPDHVCNGDELAYADFRNQFTKALPHDAVLGEVDPLAYQALLSAIRSGAFGDFESVPLAGARKLVCPLGTQTYEMLGPDSHNVTIPAAPAFNSAWQAGEMVEVYWKSLLRDVRFSDYAGDASAASAAADLSGVSDFRGPKVNGQVTPDTLFRGFTAGDQIGPYISQFLWRDIPFGPTVVKQSYNMSADGDDRGTNYMDWLAIQNGNVPGSPTNLPGANRYIITGRDLGQYVHFDFTFQAYMNAALILLGLGGGALANNNPYKSSSTQAAFVNFGGPEILDLVTKAANCGLKAAWFQKWGVHRRARPEVFGGRLHNQVTGAKDYGIHPDVLNSGAVSETFSRFGTYLHAQAYPEGSPTHCSYPAGHAVVAGACVTILKAFFDTDFVLSNPVIPDANGMNLRAYSGPALTIGAELDKLASNISIGRNIAGVHWRTDGDEGMRQGEQVAIGMLLDYRMTRPEPYGDFEFTSFDGETITV